MTRYFLPLLLYIFVACKSESPKPLSSGENTISVKDTVKEWEQKKMLRIQLDSVFAETNLNGIVSVYRNSQKYYERAQGFENFKTKKPLDSNSVFAIGSVSKQFAAAMIMRLEENGKLSTADKISKYLPEYRSKTFEEITIHHLLTHTSGISDLGPGLQSKPGAEFNYSNKGYRVLGEIVESASGKSYDENARELFAKAGISNTYTAEHFTGKNLAGAHTGTARNATAVQNMPRRLAHSSISTAAGGILSTASDLHRWNLALYNGKLLQPNSLKKFLAKTSEMKHPVIGPVNYGYGIMLAASPASYLHTGYVNGSPSLSIFYPDSNTSVVILSNIADMGRGKNAVFNPHKEVKRITDMIENALTEMNSTPPKKVTVNN
ncbi:beta-lactamase family protein [Marnyiella aurantia]|uniref:Beta-lactamase family protein n=1 Tax=Marnyiella aurantia TaxID=2758037 RepID=A0A7D7LQC2_9FLAO|nr:serine hydrolase domain-containing protein [Marnyiella aurantia]MBA5247798.1 beta-lactamase family protein [Marnyiella aurantia]QMS97377.1 beta-lactamase family protein [Marnyiella aurantia]